MSSGGLSAVGCVLLAHMHSQALALRSMPSWAVVVPAALLLAGAADVVVDCHWTHGCAQCGTSLHAHCVYNTHCIRRVLGQRAQLTNVWDMGPRDLRACDSMLLKQCVSMHVVDNARQ